jgi:hypothetical protein
MSIKEFEQMFLGRPKSPEPGPWDAALHKHLSECSLQRRRDDDDDGVGGTANGRIGRARAARVAVVGGGGHDDDGVGGGAANRPIGTNNTKSNIEDMRWEYDMGNCPKCFTAGVAGELCYHCKDRKNKCKIFKTETACIDARKVATLAHRHINLPLITTDWEPPTEYEEYTVTLQDMEKIVGKKKWWECHREIDEGQDELRKMIDQATQSGPRAATDPKERRQRVNTIILELESLGFKTAEELSSFDLNEGGIFQLNEEADNVSWDHVQSDTMEDLLYNYRQDKKRKKQKQANK